MSDRKGFEAIKVAMSQTKDGCKLVLVLHPHDDPAALAELFGQPVGQRYMLALVPIDDNEQPKEPEPQAPSPIVADAGKLCRSPSFQQWMHAEGLASNVSEAGAEFGIYRHCDILTRKSLATNEEAARKFNTLRLRFSQSRGT